MFKFYFGKSEFKLYYSKSLKVSDMAVIRSDILPVFRIGVFVFRQIADKID